MPARSAIYEKSDINIAARSAIYLKYNAEFFLVMGIIPLIPSKKAAPSISHYFPRPSSTHVDLIINQCDNVMLLLLCIFRIPF